MKDVEPNRHFSDLGGTSATRLTPCEVAQYETLLGAVAALCIVISSWQAECQSSLFPPKKPRNFGRLKGLTRVLICCWSRESRRRGGTKTPARQMKCDNVTPVKSDRKLLPSSRLVKLIKASSSPGVSHTWLSCSWDPLEELLVTFWRD